MFCLLGMVGCAWMMWRGHSRRRDAAPHDVTTDAEAANDDFVGAWPAR